MTVLIGITGPAGAGKSTAAQYLVERYGAKHYSLARQLKEIVRRAFELRPEQVYGTQAEKDAFTAYGVSGRWLLQRVGTEGCRTVLGSDFWTKQCLGLIAQEAPALAVIDDVRFADEARAIRAAQAYPFGFKRGIVWRLCLPLDEPRPKTPESAHASETEWRDMTVDWSIAPERAGNARLFSYLQAACAAFRIKPEVAL